MKKIFCFLAFTCVVAVLPIIAQEAVPPPAPDYQPLSPDQLDQLLAPIALYPDPLMAEILPASTLPTEIVLADRYVSGGGDPNAIEQQPWDASVQALAHYPNVLQWMDDNLNWTTQVGQAFLNQQQDVMDSIQRLRTAAYNLGNLQTTPQQEIVNDGGYIEILPVNPDEVYLPDYLPDEVYYQSGYGLTFGAGFPIGIWLNCDFDWHHRHLIAWDHDHPRPHDWWHERPHDRDDFIQHHATEWRPSHREEDFSHNRGDRGWNNPGFNGRQPIMNHPATPPHNMPGFHHAEPGRQPIENRPGRVEHPAPAPAPHEQPMGRGTTGAFIGIQSSHDTRAFSERGHESMQSIGHSAPAPRPAPPSNPGGGGMGGGGRGGRH